VNTQAHLKPWELPDDKLLAECRIDAFVGPGPGGQKRHKTNAAIRITHLPTSIHTVATDSRSQRENKIHAIRYLRHKLALEIRHDIDRLAYRPPPWLADYPGLHMNEKNPLYPSLVAEVLDLFKAMHWNIASVAVMLATTTTALTRFLHEDPQLWAHINHTRNILGMPPLRWRRS
jgi:hypothetical protein